MKRQRPGKAELLARFARMHPSVRPKLRPDQLLDLSLCHNINLDAIATGTAEPGMLWDFTGCVLTWWKVARLLNAGTAEMDQQLELATQLVERYSRTNRVLFTGPDLQLARDGVVVMDQLAALVDVPTATAAANWSEREGSRIANAARQLAAQEQAATQPQPMEAAT